MSSHIFGRWIRSLFAIRIQYPTIAIMLSFFFFGCNNLAAISKDESSFHVSVQPRDNIYSHSKLENDISYSFDLIYFIKNTSNETQYFSVNTSHPWEMFTLSDSRIVFEDPIERLPKAWKVRPEEFQRRQKRRKELTMNVALPPGKTAPGELSIKIVGLSSGTIRANLTFSPWIYENSDTSRFKTNFFVPKPADNFPRKTLGKYQSNAFEIDIIP